MRALITGGARGIGAEIVRQLRERRIDVVAPTRAELPLESTDRILRFAASVGRLDILVNCAGILPDEGSARGFAEGMAVNALAPLTLTNALADGLRGGRVVNVSSVYGLTSKADAERPYYSASKAALNSFSRVLARKYAGKIDVNAMCPGLCRTRLGGANAPRSAGEGAAIAVWLALDAPEGTTGRFFIGPGSETFW